MRWYKMWERWGGEVNKPKIRMRWTRNIVAFQYHKIPSHEIWLHPRLGHGPWRTIKCVNNAVWTGAQWSDECWRLRGQRWARLHAERRLRVEPEMFFQLGSQRRDRAPVSERNSGLRLGQPPASGLWLPVFEPTFSPQKVGVREAGGVS